MCSSDLNRDLEELKNKHLEELKNKQTEMNSTVTEMKNTLEGINSRITEAEERISDLEDKIVEITTAEQIKEKGMKRIEDSEVEPRPWKKKGGKDREDTRNA